MRRIAPGGGRPGGEDLVVLRVGRVERGRLVGVAVADVDVPQPAVGDQRPVVPGRVHIERGPDRRRRQPLQLGGAACLDDRLGHRRGQRDRRKVGAGHQREPQPGPAEVLQPHHQLVRGVVRPPGEQQEVRRIVGEGARQGRPQPPAGDHPPRGQDDHRQRREDRDQLDDQPPPRAGAEGELHDSDPRRRDSGEHDARSEVGLRPRLGDPREVGGDRDAVPAGAAEEWLQPEAAEADEDREGGAGGLGRTAGGEREAGRDPDQDDRPHGHGDPAERVPALLGRSGGHPAADQLEHRHDDADHDQQAAPDRPGDRRDGTEHGREQRNQVEQQPYESGDGRRRTSGGGGHGHGVRVSQRSVVDRP